MDWKDSLKSAFGDMLEDLPEEKPAVEKQLVRKQNLRVESDKRGKGKRATLITGFDGSDEELQDLARQLKSRCSSGGSARGGEILIQGDFHDKIAQMLLDMGHKVKKIG